MAQETIHDYVDIYLDKKWGSFFSTCLYSGIFMVHGWRLWVSILRNIFLYVYENTF